jgi:Ca2+-binding RTX toxin-like protein
MIGVSGGNGKDSISTGAGNDIIDERSATVGTASTATTSANSIDAGMGHDTLAIRAVFDSLSGRVSETFDIKGGTGTDLVYLDTGLGGFGAFGNQFTVAGNQINVKGFSFPGSPATSAKLATLSGVEQVVDANGDQVWTLKNGAWTEARQVRSLTGTLLSEDVKGGACSDTLKGGGGFDRFTGGAGSDTVELEGRSDFYTVAASSTRKPSGSGYRYTEDGFTGVSFTSSLTPKLPGFSVAADVEKLRFADGTFNYKFVSALNPQGLGTINNDIIVVDTGAQPIAATAFITLGAGKDYVAGIGNISRIDGGTGNDRVSWRGAADNAKFNGGDGHDSISVAQLDRAAINVVIDGGNGDDTLGYSAVNGSAKLFGGAGDDQIFSSLMGTVDGGSGNDVITLMIDKSSDGPAVQGSATGGIGEDLLVVLGNSTEYTIKATTGGFIVTNLSDSASALVQSIEAVRFDNTAIDLTKAFATYQGTASSITGWAAAAST